MTPLLEASGIRHSYRGGLRLVVDEIAAERGEVMAMLGPSGAGKSTLLRILALLEAPRSGEVRVDGRPAGSRNLQTRRRMAAALQAQVLWQGTVIQNVEFGMRVRAVRRAERRRRAEQALAEVGLAGFEGRSVNEISGGQAQRVGLARALAVEPEILFLDEPLAHIDEPLRERLASDLHRFVRRTECAAVWVTHDRVEALGVADRVAVLDEGRLLQWGPAMEVFKQPSDERVARLVGAENVIAGEVVANHDGLARIQSERSVLEAMTNIEPGGRVFVLVRPEDVSVWNSPPLGASPRNFLEGKITQVVNLGALRKLTIASEPSIVSLVTRPSYEELGFAEGKRVWAGFKAASAHVVPRT